MRSHVHAGPPASLAPFALASPAKAVPLVAFEDTSGKHHTLAEFHGRYVLLNLWAVWCAPCVKELPALARLGQAVPPGQLAVIAVDVGREGASDAAGFLKAHGAVSLKPYVDGDLALMRAFEAEGLPLTVLIDPNGREIGRAEGGAAWDTPEAIAYFKSLQP
ncbi:MAG TPA: TlpA disulfide reductase family protein [Rhizomicrobium sp.]